jgi:exonuclease SbcC
MWQLKNIYAKNVCVLEELNYTPKQGCTTLIFGYNADNESQQSNGSGKSALIEAIAIGLTGEPLRPITKLEEIINDEHDEATIRLTLDNQANNKSMIIKRVISRNASQAITVSFRDLNSNGEYVAEVQANVNEYNRFILDTIGISKDDMFSNFILSKHKYKSFLTCSDREKKELINRFSNGVLVDESIEYLGKDIAALEADLHNKEITVSYDQGQLSAINSQIESLENSAPEREAAKLQTIEKTKQAIERALEDIANHKKEIETCNNLINEVEEADKELQSLQNSSQNIFTVHGCVIKVLEPIKGAILTDSYLVKAQRSKDEFLEKDKIANQLEEKLFTLKNEASAAEIDVDKANKLLVQAEEVKESKLASLRVEYTAIKHQQADIEQDIAREKKKLSVCEAALMQAKTKLMSAIACPKCSHAFVVSSGQSVDELNDIVREQTEAIATIKKDIENKTIQVEQKETQLKELMDSVEVARAECNAIADALHKCKVASREKQIELQNVQWQVDNAVKSMNDLVDSMLKIRERMFDDAFDSLDCVIRGYRNTIRQHDAEITVLDNMIPTYYDTIDKLEKQTTDDALIDAKKRQNRQEISLSSHLKELHNIENELNELKMQERRFVDFKTHLANSKIDALSRITNDFLEKIGSDIRVRFAGFTLLKSGKIRDKISIGIIRDGIDCGSFGKFSEGEKTRVNLASILALHTLSNLDSDKGNGLDLLVLDEILDATDESGLASMFDALNSLQITSLVVSHGLIHENYPHKLVVVKHNNIANIIINES